MFLLSCHTRYRIDTLMNYPMGILVQKLMITESKSKGFLWGIFFCLFWVFLFVFFGGGLFVCLFWFWFFWSPLVITVKLLGFKYVCLQVWVCAHC